ncbi:MAG: PQQ-like beta-propeller repeat protein [Bacteroidales bacterium]|nr:PQQ-like beta-propeller repeat protein [Bacteroidales bacterium]
MKEKKIITAVTVSVILIYVGIIVGWQLYTPERNFEIQAPGADNRPEGQTRSASDVLIGEFFMKYEEVSPTLTGKWTHFRGENSSNIITTSEQIKTSSDEYPVLWSVETGEGHAAPVIYNGRVYFLDYNEQLSSDALRCFDLESGTELWRRWYRVPIKRNHGFSRTVPAISDDYIITIGPEGHVMCCDPVTGEMKWSLDMQKQFATEVPFWYTGQCPYVDEDILVLAPAGEEVLLAGIDCRSGEIVWTTPNTLNYKMSHSSVMPMTLHGKKTYVYIGVGGVCGISAEKSDRGTLLWETGTWQPSVVAPSPLQLSSSQVFLVAGYGSGGARLQVNRSGSQWTASITEQHKPNAGLASEQQTPILYNDMLISVMPKDGGGNRERLVYYSPSNLNMPVWVSASDQRFGLGPYIVINKYLFVFKDDGELYVYEILPKSMNLLKKQRIMDGADAWGPLAYADGMLIVRDAHAVKCLKII